MIYVGQNCRIFVSIAAYRDSETPKTVRDLLTKADRPHLVRIGVLSQLDPEYDSHCIVGNTPNIHELIVDARSSKGVCWARNKIFTELLGTEDFVLQIDSHSRFDQGWDTTLIRMYEELSNPNVVIGSYPQGYDVLSGNLTPQASTRFASNTFDVNGLPVLISRVLSVADARAPMKTFAVAGGCMFARSGVIRQVPYDPHLYFTGEELNYAIRLFTHGFDLVCPHRPFMYHAYGNAQRRPLVWEDNREQHSMLQRLAFERNKHVLDIHRTSNPAALVEIEKYGIGNVRTIMDWEYFSGINLRNRTQNDRARTGELEKPH